jgi:hypothetical protein
MAARFDLTQSPRYRERPLFAHLRRLSDVSNRRKPDITFVAVNVAVGRIARLPGLPREGPECGRNPSFHLRAKWPSPPGPVFRFSGAEVVSEATAVSNIAEKRVCGKRVLSKLRSSKIALATSNNFKVA